MSLHDTSSASVQPSLAVFQVSFRTSKTSCSAGDRKLLADRFKSALNQLREERKFRKAASYAAAAGRMAANAADRARFHKRQSQRIPERAPPASSSKRNVLQLTVAAVPPGKKQSSTYSTMAQRKRLADDAEVRAAEQRLATAQRHSRGQGALSLQYVAALKAQLAQEQLQHRKEKQHRIAFEAKAVAKNYIPPKRSVHERWLETDFSSAPLQPALQRALDVHSHQRHNQHAAHASGKENAAAPAITHNGVPIACYGSMQGWQMPPPCMPLPCTLHTAGAQQLVPAGMDPCQLGVAYPHWDTRAGSWPAGSIGCAPTRRDAAKALPAQPTHSCPGGSSPTSAAVAVDPSELSLPVPKQLTSNPMLCSGAQPPNTRSSGGGGSTAATAAHVVQQPTAMLKTMGLGLQVHVSQEPCKRLIDRKVTVLPGLGRDRHHQRLEQQGQVRQQGHVEEQGSTGQQRHVGQQGQAAAQRDGGCSPGPPPTTQCASLRRSTQDAACSPMQFTGVVELPKTQGSLPHCTDARSGQQSTERHHRVTCTRATQVGTGRGFNSMVSQGIKPSSPAPVGSSPANNAGGASVAVSTRKACELEAAGGMCTSSHQVPNASSTEQEGQSSSSACRFCHRRALKCRVQSAIRKRMAATGTPKPKWCSSTRVAAAANPTACGTTLVQGKAVVAAEATAGHTQEQPRGGADGQYSRPICLAGAAAVTRQSASTQPRRQAVQQGLRSTAAQQTPLKAVAGRVPAVAQRAGSGCAEGLQAEVSHTVAEAGDATRFTTGARTMQCHDAAASRMAASRAAPTAVHEGGGGGAVCEHGQAMHRTDQDMQPAAMGSAAEMHRQDGSQRGQANGRTRTPKGRSRAAGNTATISVAAGSGGRDVQEPVAMQRGAHAVGQVASVNGTSEPVPPGLWRVRLLQPPVMLHSAPGSDATAGWNANSECSTPLQAKDASTRAAGGQGVEKRGTGWNTAGSGSFGLLSGLSSLLLSDSDLSPTPSRTRTKRTSHLPEGSTAVSNASIDDTCSISSMSSPSTNLFSGHAGGYAHTDDADDASISSSLLCLLRQESLR